MSSTLSSITNMSKGLGDAWKRLGKAPKIIVSSVAIVAFLGILAMLTVTAKGPQYEILWSNLDLADGGAIVSELERQAIPYTLEDGGSTIKVPSEHVHKTRLSLASQGLPASGVVGFESIGSNGIWATDFERRVQYIRALSGELTRTVKSIAAVEDARVHIVLPESNVFASASKPSTAAVLLTLRPLQELNATSVKGIMNLVARSVEGLKPTEVTVMDSQGRLLSEEYSEYGLGSGAVYEVAYKVEKEIEKRLVSLLSPVVGPGNVVCQVRADLDMDQVSTVSTSYVTEPEGTLRSVQEITESYSGSGAIPFGQAGGLDVPSYGTSQAEDSSFQRTETIKNFEVDQMVVETVEAPGKVKNLSVAVLVNKQLDTASENAITNTVVAALGLDPEMGDKISVTGVLFDHSLADTIGNSMIEPTEPKFNRAYIYAAAVGVALVLGTAIIAFLARRRKRHAEEPEYDLPLPLPKPVLPSPEVMQRQSTKESVEKLARSSPGTVAALLKTWILEDEH